MHSNKLKMFGQLYRKDLHEIIPEILIVVIGVVLITASFFLRSSEPSPVVIVPLILLFGLAGLLPLVASFKLLSREWSNNTVYLIMSLPVSGAMVMGAKMLVLISQFIVGTLLIAISGYVLYANGLYQYFTPQQPGYMLLQNNPELVKYLLAFYLSGLVLLIFLCCISFLSQVVGKLSRKFSGLITAGAFIAILMISGKILNAVGMGNTAANPIAIRMMGDTGSFIYNLNLSSLSYLLLAFIIFILASLIYDRKLEL
jgi:hypothetical protein